MKSNYLILFALFSICVFTTVSGQDVEFDTQADDELDDDFETINEVASAKANEDKKEILESAKHALMQNLNDKQLQIIQKLSTFAQTNDASSLMDTVQDFMSKIDDDERKELLEIFEMQDASEVIQKRSEKKKEPKKKHSKGKKHGKGHKKEHKKSEKKEEVEAVKQKRDVKLSDDEYDDIFARIQATKARLRKHNDHLQSMLNSYDKRAKKGEDSEKKKKKKHHKKHSKGQQKDDSEALELEGTMIKRGAEFSDDDFDKYLARIKATKERLRRQNEELQTMMAEEDKRSNFNNFEDDESFDKYWNSLTSEEQQKQIQEHGDLQEEDEYFDAKETKRSEPEDEEELLDDYLANYSNERLEELKSDLDQGIAKRSDEEQHDPEEHAKEVEEAEEFIKDLPLDDLEDVELVEAMDIDPGAFFAMPGMEKRSQELKDDGVILNYEDADGDEMSIIQEEEDDMVEKRSHDDLYDDQDEYFIKRSDDDFDSLNDRIDKMRNRVQNRYKSHRFLDFDEE